MLYSPPSQISNLKLTSSAFEHEGLIPAKYTCDGENTLPPLSISNVPEEAKSLALVMDDPDAPVGLWIHWVVWNVPVTKTEIAEAEDKIGTLGSTNRDPGFHGPCPPDKEHRYFFKLYALDIELDIPEGSTKDELEEAMKDHLVGSTYLMGRYDRPQNQV